MQTLLKMIVAEADLQLEDQFKFVRCYWLSVEYTCFLLVAIIYHSSNPFVNKIKWQMKNKMTVVFHFYFIFRHARYLR